jgi:hypothetical protein
MFGGVTKRLNISTRILIEVPGGMPNNERLGLAAGRLNGDKQMVRRDASDWPSSTETNNGD